jgi:hypothetical protein
MEVCKPQPDFQQLIGTSYDAFAVAEEKLRSIESLEVPI